MNVIAALLFVPTLSASYACAGIEVGRHGASRTTKFEFAVEMSEGAFQTVGEFKGGTLGDWEVRNFNEDSLYATAVYQELPSTRVEFEVTRTSAFESVMTWRVIGATARPNFSILEAEGSASCINHQLDEIPA